VTTPAPVAVIIFGSPAAGKDAITTAVAGQNPRFRLFRKLKVGGGRTDGYRIGTHADANALKGSGAVLSEVHRYGCRYIVDGAELAALFRAGFIPIIHTADTDEFSTLTHTPWFRGVGIHLHTTREEAIRRLTRRDPDDVPGRLDVWDRVEATLRRTPIHPEMAWDTTQTPVEESAKLVIDTVEHLADKTL